MSIVQPLFSVIIVNYNAGDLLQDVVNSLKSQTFRDFEVLILDNHSEKHPLGDLNIDGLPKVRVIREKTNHGFAKGNNLAAAHANGKWLALLNPDATADERWLEEIFLEVLIERLPGYPLDDRTCNVDRNGIMPGTARLKFKR